MRLRQAGAHTNQHQGGGLLQASQVHSLAEHLGLYICVLVAEARPVAVVRVAEAVGQAVPIAGRRCRRLTLGIVCAATGLQRSGPAVAKQDPRLQAHGP
jgi:acetyl-CoA carboxylase alpha subunit